MERYIGIVRLLIIMVEAVNLGTTMKSSVTTIETTPSTYPSSDCHHGANKTTTASNM